MAKLIAIFLITFSYLNKLELVALKAINFPSEMAGRDKLNTIEILYNLVVICFRKKEEEKRARTKDIQRELSQASSYGAAQGGPAIRQSLLSKVMIKSWVQVSAFGCFSL